MKPNMIYGKEPYDLSKVTEYPIKLNITIGTFTGGDVVGPSWLFFNHQWVKKVLKPLDLK